MAHAQVAAEIVDPKRVRSTKSGRELWYPYYAGYSPEFARRFLASLSLGPSSHVFDPWNGSGTSTWAANVLGIPSTGIDLNPVMLLVAQARLLSRREGPSLCPLAKEIVESLAQDTRDSRHDPLATWFIPSSATHIRMLERRIRHVLLPHNAQGVHSYSSLAAFFYVALFRVVRALTVRFTGSNPTWVRRPKHPSQRIRSTADTINRSFLQAVESMSTALEQCTELTEATVQLLEASSLAIPLADNSVDVILTSPPYCTRIDYAITTLRELAVLGLDLDRPLRDLRVQMIGTSTVSEFVPRAPNLSWGPRCIDFLNQVRLHKSKSSGGYYYFHHLQYFSTLFESMMEISRTVKHDGVVGMVVQDSYYKDIHNPLPTIFEEMMVEAGLSVVSRFDFNHRVSIAQINPSRYRSSSAVTESVILARPAK